MNLSELNQKAAALGLRLQPAGDKLAVIPKGKCPPDFKAELLAHKSDLLAWLSSPPCPGWQTVPPDDLPLDVNRPRPSVADRERMINYLFRQTNGRPCPLAAWIVRQETAYYEGPGRTWDCGVLCYAAARDAACWQLNRTEPEAIEVLRGLEQTAETWPQLTADAGSA